MAGIGAEVVGGGARAEVGELVTSALVGWGDRGSSDIAGSVVDDSVTWTGVLEEEDEDVDMDVEADVVAGLLTELPVLSTGSHTLSVNFSTSRAVLSVREAGVASCFEAIRADFETALVGV